MISRAVTFLIRLLIRLYQRILGPMLKFAAGPAAGCRFTPSCSNYFLQAVDSHGPFLGSWIGIRRIFRCHPWGDCGYDPVPTPPPSKDRSPSCSCQGTHPHS